MRSGTHPCMPISLTRPSFHPEGEAEDAKTTLSTRASETVLHPIPLGLQTLRVGIPAGFVKVSLAVQLTSRLEPVHLSRPQRPGGRSVWDSWEASESEGVSLGARHVLLRPSRPSLERRVSRQKQKACFELPWESARDPCLTSSSLGALTTHSKE